MELKKAGGKSKAFTLSSEERERIERLLKRSFEKESGKELDESEMTEDNPDGRESSLFFRRPWTVPTSELSRQTQTRRRASENYANVVFEGDERRPSPPPSPIR